MVWLTYGEYPGTTGGAPKAEETMQVKLRRGFGAGRVAWMVKVKGLAGG